MALTIHDQELNTVKEENKRLRNIASKLMISGGREPNEEDAPYRPAPVPNPGQPPWPGYPNPPRLAGGPQLPNFKPMGRVIEGTRKGVLPMNETKIKQPLQIKQAMNYPPPTQLDKWLQLYQGPGGTLRHLDPDMRKLILNRGVMKAESANNIRSLQSSGHQTVLDDNNPGRLKIIKQFKPPRA